MAIIVIASVPAKQSHSRRLLRGDARNDIVLQKLVSFYFSYLPIAVTCD